MTAILRNLALLALLGACGGGSQPAPAEKSATPDVRAQAHACARCHKPDKLDLGGLSQGELLSKLKAIRDGTLEHPSEMTGLDDAQLEAIAAALSSRK